MTPPGIALGVKFQSTLPRRERQLNQNTTDVADLFQSTLPRRERHCGASSATGYKGVSIHAPTKGATKSVPAV